MKSKVSTAIILAGVIALAGVHAMHGINSSSEPPARAEISSRSSEISRGLASPAVLDCRIAQRVRGNAPEEVEILRFDAPKPIASSPYRQYTNALWSPSGEELVFVSPTARMRRFKASGDPGEIMAVGVSINELWLYRLDTGAWTRITNDGASPRFSADGRSLFYLRGNELIEFALDSGKSHTLVTGPATAVGLLRSMPLEDGTIVTPQVYNGTIQKLGDSSYKLPDGGFALSPIDSILPSHNGRNVAVSYGSQGSSNGFREAVTIVYDNESHQRTTLLVGCPYSGSEIAWSLDGNLVAYPVNSPTQGIDIFDLKTKKKRALLLRGESLRKISNIAFSPDNRLIAFNSQEEGGSVVWLISSDGTQWQQIRRGLLPRWAPDGSALLYATRGASGLNWHIINVIQN